MADEENKVDDAPEADAAEEKRPPKKKDEKSKAGPVRAECIKICTCRGGIRKPGDVLTFPDADSVNPHFKII